MAVLFCGYPADNSPGVPLQCYRAGVSPGLRFPGPWGASLSHHLYTVEAGALPADFRIGLLQERPSDLLESYSARAFREISLLPDRAELAVEMGLSWQSFRQAFFATCAQQPPADWCNNYSGTYRTRHSFGLSFRLRTQFRISSKAGLELAAVADVYLKKIFVGWEVNLTGSMVREKIRSLKRNAHQH
jgi:hypothetical protein